ncbi:Di-copper centre-containing protein [Serendipita vermifera]|nr:Di-copper centre-containing protein [Serendipita vermifera]
MAPLVSLLYGLSVFSAVTQVIANPSHMPGLGKRDDYNEQKKDYIKATKCLQTKSDFGISPYSDTLYDAFVYIHENNWFAFHGCAPFPPWHRWFVWLREVALRETCGYTGPFPYWNYTQDWQDPFGSPIFAKDETGFGTHGTTPYMAINSAAGTASGFKVDNGGFANLKVNLPEPHYLTRNFSLWMDTDPTGATQGKAFGKWFGPEQLKKTLAQEGFWNFEKVLDGIGEFMNLGIHNGPHFNNNGDWYGPGWLSNTTYFPFASTAPNDPMFFPHHAYVDAVFWKWQQKSGNQWKYGGSNNISDPTMNDAKLTDMLPFSGFGPDVPVALALKTENFPLCYTYDY